MKEHGLAPTGTVTLARAYSTAVHAAEKSGVGAWSETQPTAPWGVLIRGMAEAVQFPTLTMLPEAREGSIRPDPPILAGKRFAGYVEFKSPEHSVNASGWTGRNPKQWEQLKTLDAVIVSNGREARLFSLDDTQGPDASLP